MELIFRSWIFLESLKGLHKVWRASFLLWNLGDTCSISILHFLFERQGSWSPSYLCGQDHRHDHDDAWCHQGGGSEVRSHFFVQHPHFDLFSQRWFVFCRRALLEKELEDVGIRLNTRPPNIYFKVGVISFTLLVGFFPINLPCVFVGLWRSRREEASRSMLSSSWPIWTKSWSTWFSVNTVNLHVFFFFRFSPPAISMLTSGSGRLFCRDLQRRSIDKGGLHTR